MTPWCVAQYITTVGPYAAEFLTCRRLHNACANLHWFESCKAQHLNAGPRCASMFAVGCLLRYMHLSTAVVKWASSTGDSWTATHATCASCCVTHLRLQVLLDQPVHNHIVEIVPSCMKQSAAVTTELVCWDEQLQQMVAEAKASWSAAPHGPQTVVS